MRYTRGKISPRDILRLILNPIYKTNLGNLPAVVAPALTVLAIGSDTPLAQRLGLCYPSPMSTRADKIDKLATKESISVREALMQAERFRTAGRLGDAERVYRTILENNASLHEAEHSLGLIMRESGRLDDAIEHIRRATLLAPQLPLYHANLGEMLRLAGRLNEAEAEGRRAIELQPDYPEALSNLGVALFDQGRFEDAVAQHRRAIAVKPDFPFAHNNLGNALHRLKRFDEAAMAYRRAIELDRNFADAWSNYGSNLHHSGVYDEAMAAMRRAIALAPNNANAHSGLGILLLMHGNFGEGWDEYEWRLRAETKKAPTPKRPWRGESLASRHIYVRAEQGFGDSIQFVRYLLRLKAHAGKVSFAVPPTLVRLMSESLPGIEVIAKGGPSAPPDYDCALLSLAHIFKTRFETIPATIPYLRPPAEVAARWRQQLGTAPGLRVGIVWAGRSDHANDFRRSIEFAALGPIFAVPGVSFASLQVGSPLAALAAHPTLKIADLSPQLKDFAETAGAIAALDLVIAVDTAVAHLAGALGRPVWVLLPWVTDWRWLLEREDNPWYPTMRLFRSNQDETLPDIVGRVAEELAAVASGDTSRLMPFKVAGERRALTAAEIIAAADSHAAPVSSVQALPQGNAPTPGRQQRRAASQPRVTSQGTKAPKPGSAEAEHERGIAAYRAGKIGEAVSHLRRAVAVDDSVGVYHANLCEMLRLSGRIEEAIAAGHRATELDPDQPRSHNNLGIALYQSAKFDDARRCYDRAIELAPDFAEAHSNRGNALRALKKLDDAESSYRRALEIQPKFAAAWNNLGTCLRELKHIEKAEAAYRKAIELEPGDATTLDNLALAVKDLGRLDEAAGLLRKALTIDPQNEAFHIHFGTVLLDQRDFEGADVEVERALERNPNSWDAFGLMGRIALGRGDAELALKHFRRALTLRPDLADTHNNMGNALKELGRFEEALEAFNRALRLDPANSAAYVNLADSKTFKPNDSELAAMESLAAQYEGLSKLERMHLDFALGKAYADLKDYDRAFARLRSANVAKRQSIAYDEKLSQLLFERIEQVFTPELIATKSGGGDPSPMPIFVIGMPRSGTTLIEQIIASHPAVHGAGELRNLTEVVLSVRGADRQTIPYPEFIPAIAPAALQQIGSRYIKSLDKLVPERPMNCEHVTDKMPSNYYFAGLIHLALPNATIIHTVRDPVDTCVSCFSKLFSAEQNHTYDLGELGRYYKDYEHLMQHWHRVLPAGRILDVRYEDVVADLEKEARRIIAHCGLAWDDRCLSFHQNDRPVRTASATQVRQPIYGSAVGRWRVYENYLGPLLTALGISSGPSTSSDVIARDSA